MNFPIRKTPSRRLATAVLMLPIMLLLAPQALAAVNKIAWLKYFGVAAGAGVNAAAADGGGNIYVAGSSEGSLAGQPYRGLGDVFVRKMTTGGRVLWTRQFGSAARDYTMGAGAETLGKVYIVGNTEGSLPGQRHLGDTDAFIRKYGPGGKTLWTRQFGTNGSDQGAAVAISPGGSVYVVGNTGGKLPGQTSAGGTDPYLRKYGSGGNTLWTRQFGTSTEDVAWGVATDPEGNIYVTGFTMGTLPRQTSAGGTDTYIRKYRPDGTVVWTRQFGTSADDEGGIDIAYAPGGYLYVAGQIRNLGTDGSLKAFVRKYTTSGVRVWTRQFGSDAEFANAVEADRFGNAYVSGSTNGLRAGESFDPAKAFVRKYNPGGTAVWTRNVAGQGGDGGGQDMAVDSYNGLAAAGIKASSSGDNGSWIARFAP